MFKAYSKQATFSVLGVQKLKKPTPWAIHGLRVLLMVPNYDLRGNIWYADCHEKLHRAFGIMVHTILRKGLWIQLLSLKQLC